MKLQPIFNRIRNNENLQKKYLNISDYNMSDYIQEQLYLAKDGIINYAKHKNIKIGISDNTKMFSDYTYPSKKKYYDDRFILDVTDLKSRLSQRRLIPYINDESLLKPAHMKEKFIIINYPQDGLQRAAKVISSFEETFLRNLYRNIEELTVKVKGK